jgi:PhzF family phenazine biosynthesis protein
MKYTLYQVDAFASQLFSGNPAAVVPLTQWLSDELLQKIAAENNLSETVYYIIKEDVIEIRWFTPAAEVDLCGHATLATAFVLKNQEGFTGQVIPFYSHRSGHLPVTINEGSFTMNFPCDIITEVELTDALKHTSNKEPLKAFKGKTDYMLVFEKQSDISSMQPNFSAIEKLQARGLIVTAKGEDCDFVSRFFGPQCGVNEDPVTGSAHTTLTPYWSSVLNKHDFTARQLSARSGDLACTLVGDRVEITGKAVLFMKGEFFI